MLVAGIRDFHRRKKQVSGSKPVAEKDLPTFSVVVPAKNEEVVLPRLLNALLSQNYPKEKFEVIVVEDGSTDGTLDVCKSFVKDLRTQIKIVRGEDSNGKPSALNRALGVSRGDIVAIFDADNIPEPDTLANAAMHFQDGSIVALQGRTLTVNSDANMLTKFVSYEEAAWFEGYMRGKDCLDLFVHLKGSCQFIRRRTLESIGRWSEKHLSEDLEMSARLVKKGLRIRYASDVRSWQECPETLAKMFRQRIRWYRGAMEVALNYGRLVRRPSWKILDAEITLFGPFILIASLLSYVISPLILGSLSGTILLAVTLAGWISLTASLVVGALALVYVAKPKRKRDVLWLPFIYAYWSFQVVLACWALMKIVFRVPKEWKKTSKTGTVTAANTLSQGSDS